MWVRPPDTTPSTTETVAAVRPVEFQETAAEREAPTGDTHNEVNRPGNPTTPDARVGQLLDTTA